MTDQFSNPIVLGGEDPKKPLSRLAKAIDNKIKTRTHLNYQSLPPMAPGYVPAPKPAIASEDIQMADQEEAAALKDAEPIIKDISTQLFGEDGSFVSRYTKRNDAGNNYLGEEFKSAVAKINEQYGGDGRTLNVLETRLRVLGETYIEKDNITAEAMKYAKANGLIDKATAENKLATLHAQRQATMDSLAKGEKEKFNTKVKTLVAERDEALQALTDAYDYHYILMGQQAKLNKEAEVLDKLMQRQKELEDQVNAGEIDHQEAARQMEQYNSEQSNELQHYKDRYWRHDVRPVFEQKFGADLANSYNEAVSTYARKINSEAINSKERMGRMLREQNRLLRSEKNSLLQQIDRDNYNIIKDAYAKGAEKVYNRKRDRELAFTAKLYGQASTPLSAPAALARLFGRSFMSTYGSIVEGVGKYLQSQGIDIAYSRMLSRKGYELKKDYETFKPDLSAEVLSPGFFAQSIGSLSASSVSTIGLTVLTRNPFLAGTLSAVQNSASMAGQAVEQSLENGVSPADAVMRANQFFAKNLIVNAASEIILSKAFKMAFRGDQGIKAVAVATPTEFMQETTENTLQDMAINPSLDFGQTWLSDKNMKAGLEASMGAGFLTGATNIVSIFGKKVPAVDKQWIASMVQRNGSQAAHMVNEMDFHNGDISEAEFESNRTEIDLIGSKYNDAKKAGLNDAQAMLHVAFSMEADAKRQQAEIIEDPKLKEAVRKEAENLDAKAMQVVDGTVEAALINVGGVGTVAAEPQVAKEVQEQLDNLTVEPFEETTDDQEITEPISTEPSSNASSEPGVSEFAETDSAIETTQPESANAEPVQEAFEIAIDEPQQQTQTTINESTQNAAGQDEEPATTDTQQGDTQTPAGAATQTGRTDIEGQTTQDGAGQTDAGNTVTPKRKGGRKPKQSPAAQPAITDDSGATATAGAADESTEVDEKERRALRRKFLDENFNTANPMSGISLISKLPSHEAKTKKLTAIMNRMVTAKKENLIDFEEFESLSNVINHQFVLLGEKTRVPSLAAQRKAEAAAKADVLAESLAAQDKAAEPAEPQVAEPSTETQKPARKKAEKKLSAKEKSKMLAEKVMAHRIKNDTAYDAMLGIPVAIYNGMLVAAAKAIEAGGTVAQAIDDAMKYVQGILDSKLRHQYFEPGKEVHPEQLRKEFEILFDGIMTKGQEEKIEGQVAGKTRAKYIEALAEERKQNIAKLNRVKARFGKVNMAGGIPSDAYNNGLQKAIGILQQEGSVLDALDAMVSYISGATGKTDGEVRPDVIAGFKKLKIRLGRFHTNGPTDTMSMMDLFKHRVETEKNLAAVIGEMISHLSVYFRSQGVDMSKGRVASVMKTLAAIANDDIDIELLSDTMDRIEMIIATQGVADKIAAANRMVQKFRSMVRNGYHLTDSNVNRLLALEFPRAEDVTLATGSVDIFHETIKGLLDAFGTQQGRRAIASTDIEKMIDRFQQISELVTAMKQERLEQKVQRMIDKGKLPADTDIAIYVSTRMVEKAEGDTERIEKANAQKEKEALLYRQQIRLMQAELHAQLDSGEHSFNAQQLKTARSMAEVDVFGLGDPDLARFVTILNNILLDGDFNSADAIIIQATDKPAAEKELTSANIKTRAVGKILGHFDTSRMHGFTNLLEAITFSKESAAKLRRIVFGEAEHGIAKAQAIMEKVRKEFIGLVEKKKIRLLEQHRLGVYAFLKQSSSQADFEERLAKIIKGSVEGLYLQGLRFDASKEGSGEPHRSAAENTATALRSLGLIGGFQVSRQGIAVQPQTELDFTELDSLLSEAENEVYAYVRRVYDELGPDFEHVARSVYGMDVRMIAHYFPMIAHRYKPDTKHKDELQDALDIFDYDNDNLSVPPADRMKKRGQLAGDDKYYNMGFVDVFLNAYHQSLTAVYAGRGLRKAAKVINASTFRQFVQGEFEDMTHKDNQRIFMDKMQDVFQDLKNAPYLYPTRSGAIGNIFNVVASRVIRTFLSRVDQIVVQYAPNWTSTMIELGPEITGKATLMQFTATTNREYNNKYNEFLKHFSGQFRSPLGMEAFDEHVKDLNSPGWWRATKAVDATINAAGKWALQTADKGVFHVSLIGGYLSHLIRSGKINHLGQFNIDEHIASPDAEALSYAETIAARINNESNRAYRADVIKNKTGDPTTFLWMLGSYSLNSFMGFYNSGRTAFSSRASSEEKIHAWRNMFGYVAQMAVFNILKTFVTNLAYEAGAEKFIEGVLGVTLRELSDEEKQIQKEKKIVKIAAQTFADIAFGGMPSISRAAVEGGLNLGFQEWAKSERKELKEKGIKQQIKGSILDPNFMPYYSATSSYGGGMEAIAAGLRMGYDALIKENKNPMLPDDINEALDDMENVAFASLILGSGDIYKMANAGRAQLKQQTKVKQPTSSKGRFGLSLGLGLRKF